MMKRLVLTLGVVLFTLACGGDGGVTGPPGGDGGRIEGRVNGPGGGVPGASVSLAGGGSTQSGSDGGFAFTNVTAGQATVTVTPPDGFAFAPGETAAKSLNVTSGGSVSATWNVRLSDTEPKTVEVGLGSTSFNPSDVTVPVGSTINWVNQTATAHTISPNEPSKTGTWMELTITGAGTEFNHTFGTAGTFDYVCKLHAGMTGVIRVH